MNTENMYSVVATIGVGFLAGLLIGYAFKKVLKVVAIVVGLFLAGVAYLQYQQIIKINWNKLQHASQNAITTLANAITQIPGFNNSNHTAVFVMSNLGIPLTGSVSVGFAIGFLRG